MKYDNYRKVIDRIYKLGKEKGFTIKELASICGVSEDYFASCRFKKNYPNTDCIIKVSQNLDVSIDFILSGVDNKVLKDLNVVQTGIRLEAIPAYYRRIILSAVNYRHPKGRQLLFSLHQVLLVSELPAMPAFQK